MNCDWLTTETDDRGWRKVRCTRGACDNHSTWTPDPPERIHAECKAWPRWHEWGYIIEHALAFMGLNQYRWNVIRGAIGFTGKCGCQERIEAINNAGGWWAQRWQVLLRLVMGSRSQ